MKIAIGSDHAGVALKDFLVKNSNTEKFVDFGTNSSDSVDYPDFAEKVSLAVKKGEAEIGVLICGSGIGMSIAANRHKEIRAALCLNEEMAKLSRQHNNANVLVLGARLTDEKTALSCLKTFLSTKFEGGRHQKRVDKLS